MQFNLFTTELDLMQHFFLLIYLSCLQKKNNYIYKISNQLNIHID